LDILAGIALQKCDPGAGVGCDHVLVKDCFRSKQGAADQRLATPPTIANPPARSG
jgi:hypothetical protein